MYLSINIILILILVICLLNMCGGRLLNMCGGRLLDMYGGNELKLYKDLEKDISIIKNKLKEIDAEIEKNKVTLHKQKNLYFISSTRSKMLEIIIIIKNLITEKEKYINMLNKREKRYKDLLKGGTSQDKIIPMLDKINSTTNESINLDSSNINNQNIETNNQNIELDNQNIESNNQNNLINYNDITQNQMDYNNNEETETDNSSILESNDSEDDSEDESNDNLDNNYTNNLLQDIELDNFKTFTEKLVASNTNIME